MYCGPVYRILLWRVEAVVSRIGENNRESRCCLPWLNSLDVFTCYLPDRAILVLLIPVHGVARFGSNEFGPLGIKKDKQQKSGI